MRRRDRSDEIHYRCANQNHSPKRVIDTFFFIISPDASAAIGGVWGVAEARYYRLKEEEDAWDSDRSD